MNTQGLLNGLVGTFKKCVTFAGRATRAEYWFYVLAEIIIFAILGVICALADNIDEALGYVFTILFAIVALFLTVCHISLLVRRLHDLDLSGFWIWYLNPSGLPVIFVLYLLGLDTACEKVVSRIQGTGSPWLGWILTWLFWPFGSVVAMILLTLYKGKSEDNEFGPNPY
jgi:uncharacterized membrane protein YhaH (DUF805 family)